MIAEMFSGPVGPRQHPRCSIAHMTNAESKNKTVKANFAAQVDGLKQFLDTGLAPAFTVFQFLVGTFIACRKGENIRW